MLHFGDITKISGFDVPIVDVCSFGAPCQDISVAGLRKGMKHEANGDEETTRSGLFYDAIRIIKEMRENDRANGRADIDIRPRFGIYENVPGALSSNKGEDWRCVLESLASVAEEGVSIPRPNNGKWTTSGAIIGEGWSISWRILSAQLWGTSSKPLPQRRRRIVLVADFGGQSAPEILFVRKSVSGNIEPGETPRKETACNIARGVGADDRKGEGFDGYNGALTGQKSATLGVNCGMTTGRNGVIECFRQETAFSFQPVTDEHILDDQGGSVINVRKDGKAPTLRAETHGNLPAVVYAVDQGGGKSGANVHEDKAPTLCTTHGGEPAVAYGIDGYNIATNYIVRRLTPTECERLQGYPDGWTDIGEYTDTNGKKRKSSDAARYKALGNSIALPPWKWVMKRISACYERDATLASLFDGIGGFPYIWEQINGKGSCLWASEIEEFCIAVTKRRIG